MQANSLLNASRLEQQMLAEGAATPAPTKGGGAGTAQGDDALRPMSEDFSDWAVGERYEMVRILGRGSYGEVAQAIDRRAGKEDAFVAIKRIQSPFDQEVDAVRLYREIHILRQMRGHECIIQLVDVVQPPTEDLDDFHDLYLVFECTWQRRRHGLVSPHCVSTFVLTLLRWFSLGQTWIPISISSFYRPSISPPSIFKPFSTKCSPESNTFTPSPLFTET